MAWYHAADFADAYPGKTYLAPTFHLLIVHARKAISLCLCGSL
jgi:hypothetical protein